MSVVVVHQIATNVENKFSTKNKQNQCIDCICGVVFSPVVYVCNYRTLAIPFSRTFSSRLRIVCLVLFDSFASWCSVYSAAVLVFCFGLFLLPHHSRLVYLSLLVVSFHFTFRFRISERWYIRWLTLAMQWKGFFFAVFICMCVCVRTMCMYH